MRSQLVYSAKENFPNRFELMHQTAKFVRALHRGNERIGDGINQALERMSAPKAAFVAVAGQGRHFPLMAATQSGFTGPA